MTDTTDTTPSSPRTPRRKPAEVPFSVKTDVTWVPRKRGAAGGPRERGAYQTQIDELVKSAFADGKPRFMEVAADGQIVKDLERRIRNSGTHLGYGIRFGEDQASKKSGFVIMSFTVGVKRKRTVKPKD